MVFEQYAVEEFHKKHGFPNDLRVKNIKLRWYEKAMVWPLYWFLVIINKLFLRYASADLEHREYAWRIHLILEETTELLYAFLIGDELLVADAIADLLYVAIGVGVAYFLPCAELFEAVHRSNMTKDTRNKEADLRLRRKGSGYIPPDIIRAIMLGRRRLCSS
jgi:hypothetical protein